MKAIINGKRYDTETAVKVFDWSGGYCERPSKPCVHTLYVTKNNSWFLTQSCDRDSGCKYHGITPMSLTEARSWLEERGYTDLLEKHFANHIVDA